MTAVNFCYWLQGMFELAHKEGQIISAEQATEIKKHLRMVFVHDIDPKAGGPEVQEKLNAIHGSSKPGMRC